MLRRVTARICSVGAALLAGALALGANSAAHAAGSCLVQPGRQAEPGSHWYYRVDRTSQQKCWYLKRSDGLESAAETSETADSPPQLFSWLSSAFSNITRPPSAEQDARDPQTTDPSRRRRAQVRPERPEAPKARAKPPVRSVAQPAATPTATAPLDDPATSELYQDFLQWRARQLLTTDPAAKE
jgi:hypothetical protein